MRHQCKVPAVRRAHSGNTADGSAGIERVGHRGMALVVNILHCDHPLVEELGDELLSAIEASLAVRNPHAKDRAGHAGKHHGAAFGDDNAREPRFEPVRLVADEPRLFLATEAFTGSPAQECQQLTSVADTQGERIFAPVEPLELGCGYPIEANHPPPSLT